MYIVISIFNTGVLYFTVSVFHVESSTVNNITINAHFTTVMTIVVIVLNCVAYVQIRDAAPVNINCKCYQFIIIMNRCHERLI